MFWRIRLRDFLAKFGRYYHSQLEALKTFFQRHLNTFYFDVFFNSRYVAPVTAACRAAASAKLTDIVCAIRY